MIARRLVSSSLCMAGLIAMMPGSCMLTVSPGAGESGGGAGSDPGNGTGTTITVRIVNDTPNTLDPEIYVAATSGQPADLFVAGNKYTDFGVGRLGILVAGGNASFTVDCDAAAMIGTRGGSFGGGDDGNDLNNPAGTGLQRVLTRELVFFCGDTITFTYHRDGEGFTTTFDLDP